MGKNTMKRWKQRLASQRMPKICRRLGERQEDAPSLTPEGASPAGTLFSALQSPELRKHTLLIFKSPSLGSHHGGRDKGYKVLGKGIMDTAVGVCRAIRDGRGPWVARGKILRRESWKRGLENKGQANLHEPTDDLRCPIRGFGSYSKFRMPPKEGQSDTPFTISRTRMETVGGR